jgi:hypothetical protein
MFEFPALPEVPPEQKIQAPVSLRYEDIAQDGRLLLDAIPHSLGEVIWQGLLSKHPMHKNVSKQGAIPILSRVVVESLEGPIAVRRSLDGEGAYQLAHTVDDRGEVNRLILNLWSNVYGPRSRTYGPPPPGAGERIHLGRCYAEHVFTRLFAPPEQRKVLRFEGVPDAVPAARHDWKKTETLLALPEGAVALDGDLRDDAAPLVLGAGQTDSNQHVNSMVYPRLFEQAALRRFDEHHRSADVQPRFVECAYRKPSFAGERVRFRLRAFQWNERLGAVGTLIDDRGDDKRPRVYVRMLF